MASSVWSPILTVSMTPSPISCRAENEENWPNYDVKLLLRFLFSSSFFWNLALLAVLVFFSLMVAKYPSRSWLLLAAEFFLSLFLALLPLFAVVMAMSCSFPARIAYEKLDGLRAPEFSFLDPQLRMESLPSPWTARCLMMSRSCNIDFYFKLIYAILSSITPIIWFDLSSII